MTAYAVTPGLREWYASADAEELEYAASGRAARASLRLLGGIGEARRVVLAVDPPADAVTSRDDLDEGAVTVAGELPWRLVAAGLVDTAGAQDAVGKAVLAVDAADLGDEDAELTVGDAEDHELAWYATQELADL
jgi:hypothetical protein